MTGSRKPTHASYRLHGQILETVTCAKYLGVEISSGLSWNCHIDRMTGSANKPLVLLKETQKQKMPDVKMAYNTLVRPQLEYAVVV